jgi:hypothetical protein
MVDFLMADLLDNATNNHWLKHHDAPYAFDAANS